MCNGGGGCRKDSCTRLVDTVLKTHYSIQHQAITKAALSRISASHETESWTASRTHTNTGPTPTPAPTCVGLFEYGIVHAGVSFHFKTKASTIL